MIHSAWHIPHPGHPAHVARRRRHARRVWAIFLLILATTGVLVAFGFFTGVDWGELGSALFLSTYRLVGGYLIGLVLGGGIALVVGWSPWSDGLFPVFDVLQNVPSFALLPIFVVLMGYTDWMIILFTATGVMWPILFAILTAIKSAHSDLNDAATIFGATGWRRIVHYLTPLSFPAIITGSVVGISIGWESVIGAELIGQAGGVGTYIGNAGSVGISPALFAGIIGILVIVFVANRLIWAPLLAESTRRYAE